MLRTYVISDPNGEKIDGTFYKKNLQKTNQKKFRLEKVIKRKGDKLYLKWKGYNNSFNSWIDKKRLKVELDLSNYAANADLKNAAGADTSKFAKKVNLAGLK